MGVKKCKTLVIEKLHHSIFGRPDGERNPDEELIEKAKAAANGAKFSKLSGGDFRDYESPSEADLALCSMLAFWTAGDRSRMDHIFRQSGLMREKWDEKHFGDGRTYGQSTIQKAIEQTTETYSSSQNPETKDDTDKEVFSYSDLHLPSSLEIARLEIDVKWVVKNLIPEQGICLLHSIGGVGKTYLMYKIGNAVAEGELFFGLEVQKMNVYYVDFENPLPEISNRMKKLGGSENLKIWHLGHDPQPVRFDADEWGIYKTFPPGLFIIDSLRSSHLLEENSSQDAAFIMARHKEIRALGNTIILIHHENKGGGYRGSTAWFDLSDHILKFCRVKAIGSDEDAQEEDLNLPIRLGLGGKSRFSSAMDLAPLYFKFQDGQLARADDPEDEILNRMAELLNPAFPPNQTEFQKLVKENLGIAAKPFRSLLKKGEEKGVWIREKSKTGNKYEYRRA
jgi:hypothetical protein